MIATALYIHIPWCIRKCPYCDFNSHKSPEVLPEADYVEALLADFKQDPGLHPMREISSVFIGGGTPSLFSGAAFARLFESLRQETAFAADVEITLEANPGTVEQQRFHEYRALGINRLSLGIQSFNAQHLRALGRIHDDKQAINAIKTARQAGFDNINLDIMHGLPGQTLDEGLADLEEALSWQPEHLSWYQLTLEPNTVFYKQRPRLPDEEENEALEEAGFAMLVKEGYERYEISAFAQAGKAARHNMNYWLFGDYYGIGAGAHGKLTLENGQVCRTARHRQPKDYLNPEKPFLASREIVSKESLIFEFMLNTTRLQQAIPNNLFCERTGLEFAELLPGLEQAANKGLMLIHEGHWQITPLGRRYTNNLQEIFLPK